jgi:hypothetical protein
MREGDRVRHLKYGEGIVDEVDMDEGWARINFPSLVSPENADGAVTIDERQVSEYQVIEEA